VKDAAASDIEREVSDWWRTSIIEMEPGKISYRGYAIEDLIGQVSYSQMIWLMLRGEVPAKVQSDLLEAALVAGVDHGPQAPSIAIARMAATCGVGLNSAMASALNVLGDIHGGAGEQAIQVFDVAIEFGRQGESLEVAAARALDDFAESGERFVPGFGHRFHPIDPRAPRLLELVDAAVGKGVTTGDYAAAARAIGAELQRRKGRQIPLNIDGATAVIYGELGFPAPLARGLFCLSRSVGILAHAWEQTVQGGRNKGPIPRRLIWTHDGPTRRQLPPEGR
jgi:citrate synthase